MANPYRFLALGLLGVFGTSVAVSMSGRAPVPQPAAPAPEMLPTLQAKPLDHVVGATLRPGESLSQLLQRAEVDAATAQVLIARLAAERDPRTLRPGAAASVRRDAETGALKSVDVRLDADHTFRMRNAAGAWTSEVRTVEVRTDTAVLSGEVSSSLYQALLDGRGDLPRGERQAIADVLAEKIFAWQVDFSTDLRDGDRYRVLYERQARPDGSARAGKILAVEFQVAGEEHTAFLYRHADGSEDYYAANGTSLKRAFLRTPVEFRRISSLFSSGRYHPILHRIRAHKGIDYAAAQGTPVRAVGDGVVARAGRGGGYGNVIEIRHGRGYSSRYGHLRGFAKGLRAGDRVKQGQVIGYVGMTGLATGPHLHYEFHTDGVAVNPFSIKYLTADPLSGQARARFRGLVAERVAVLDRRAGAYRVAAAPVEGKPAGE
ncbi:MAG TPA: peptidoglycan DD-metalloendopeptidase family protein [Longimicrobiaceae bacterium]|nr:peptidoglycan DD-metalloendopeptidase family protein [Longimicrobiaceae bacterium]